MRNINDDSSCIGETGHIEKKDLMMLKKFGTMRLSNLKIGDNLVSKNIKKGCIGLVVVAAAYFMQNPGEFVENPDVITPAIAAIIFAVIDALKHYKKK